MVDDNEFVKRRHLSRGRPRKYEPSSPTHNSDMDAKESENFEPVDVNGGSAYGGYVSYIYQTQ